MSFVSGSARSDLQEIPFGANEEVAGPAYQVTRPVQASERISSLDVLRGFSLMGILLMNITSFALPEWDYYIPLTTVKPVFSGPYWKVNTVMWFLRWVLAEGKMRALFSMLFGAGVILMTSRAEERGAGIKTADIFTRRNMWLTLFGILHCYLIWNGDILFFYGLIALLFLFPCRNLRPKKLLWAGVLVLLLNSVVFNGGRYLQALSQKAEAEKVNAALASHRRIDEKQVTALREWKKTQEDWRPSNKIMYEDIAAMQQGYWSSVVHSAPVSYFMETFNVYFGFGDVLGMMLIGMGLLRNGFLSARLSLRTYALTAIVSLGITWPVVFAGAWHAWSSHFDQMESMKALYFTYDLGRIGGALGNAAAVLVFVKLGAFRWLLDKVAKVGQMALSNYLLTSSSMKLLFVWSPLHWYGYMEYWKLYIVVACMWAVNLIWSTLWLRHFRFGPVEWLWRSLTYWKRQPMLQSIES
ncbi:MAG: DUF418 domain-containing protein [Acidobacteriaceae bacterium]|nr:DUF418 domain-containing protein [Acidobacteriaceae bacterium]